MRGVSILDAAMMLAISGVPVTAATRCCLPSAGRANLGRFHPDYGMTVAEHQAAKLKRETANG